MSERFPPGENSPPPGEHHEPPTAHPGESAPPPPTRSQWERVLEGALIANDRVFELGDLISGVYAVRYYPDTDAAQRAESKLVQLVETYSPLSEEELTKEQQQALTGADSTQRALIEYLRNDGGLRFTQIVQGLNAERDIAYETVDRARDFFRRDRDKLVSDPLAMSLFDADDQDDIENAWLESMGAGPGTGQQLASLIPIIKGDTLFTFDPNPGTPLADRLQFITKDPRLVERDLQTAIDVGGQLVAFDPRDPDYEPIVLIEDFDYAKIDPAVIQAASEDEFRQTLALRQREVLGQFVGLDLQRQGQEIAALSQSMANKIAIGELEYAEATLTLNTLDLALKERRLEREDALKLAVKKSSIIERGDERLTRLPFAEQMRKALSATSGAEVPIEEFELPVFKADPGAAARRVIEGAEFDSPVPGLKAALEATDAKVAQMVGPKSATAASIGAAVQKILGEIKDTEVT